ncbi:hypothetical protein J8J14_06590 [Roseomonas sp. SSH11]|uniref:Uncharacterized protein n=1 Tax=Pararoseomonas baculiformis TaxID=2820812 RepID=A0ABS4ADY2_9PROT|nr:hypothetical protein [Pararoseomonas baculiformis]MBP0444444.1 hypothetical protein [Pararoseomonas baculiformis]
MISRTTDPMATVIEAVEVLARYASANGMTGAQEVLMEILAVAHGWPGEGMGAAQGEASARQGGARPDLVRSGFRSMAMSTPERVAHAAR